MLLPTGFKTVLVLALATTQLSVLTTLPLLNQVV
jgi:hypothetical protein